MTLQLKTVFILLFATAICACSDDENGNAPFDSDYPSDTDQEIDTEELCCPAEKIINCGHRGTGTKTGENPFPENTIPSFEQAELEGAQMIEFDVTHSMDGEVVVIHDRELNNTTDSTGCVGDMTLEELKQLDAAHGTSMAGQGVQIPTLEEALNAIGIDVNVEIKVSTNTNCPDTDIQKLVTDVVAAIQSDTKDRTIIVSSFSTAALEAVKTADPSIYVGYLTIVATTLSAAEKSGFDGFNISSYALKEDNLELIANTDLDINVWTVNTEDEIERLFEIGVDMIITDEPQLVEQVRKSWCEAACD